MGEAVAGCTSDHHLLLAPGKDGELSGTPGEGDEAEIGGAALDLLVDAVGMKVLDMDLDGGVALVEALDGLAHVAEADGIDGGYLDGGGEGCLAARQRGFELVIASDEVLAAFVIELAGRSELEGANGAIDQANAKAPFELVDDVAGGGLGELIGGRRLGETAEAGDVTEHLEGFELHGEMVSWGILISRG
jgi:hypothetical protein